MAYKPLHRFDLKDGLNPGDPDKIIYGNDLQKEFNAISSDLELLTQDGETDQANLDAEIAARIAGDQGLQDQINAIGSGGGGGGASTWDELTGKPSTFPPEAHTHQQSEVDGLEDRLTSIEGSISSGGGFVDAPNDGKLYGRQSEAWAEIDVSGDPITYTLPVALRSGDAELPLTVDGAKLAVMTRGGELELPLAA